MVVGGAGGWAATAEISGAVVATGSVVVDSNVKKVQHPTGGVVAEVVCAMAIVSKQTICSSGSTTPSPKSNLAIVTKQLDELAARKARLEAERDGDDAITFPKHLLPGWDPEVTRLMYGRAQAIRVAARGTAWSARAVPSAYRAAYRGDPRTSHSDRRKNQEAAFIGRELTGHPRIVAEKSAADLAPDNAGTRSDAPRRRARPADRGDRHARAKSPRPNCRSFRSTATSAAR